MSPGKPADPPPPCELPSLPETIEPLPPLRRRIGSPQEDGVPDKGRGRKPFRAEGVLGQLGKLLRIGSKDVSDAPLEKRREAGFIFTESGRNAIT